MISLTFLRRVMRQPTDRPRYTGPSHRLCQMDAEYHARRRKVNTAFLGGAMAGAWVGGLAVAIFLKLSH